MKTRSLLNSIAGIATEIGYAAAIIAAALVVCLAFSLRR
jgi:hypothetical protein